jgi:hypothetical protein
LPQIYDKRVQGKKGQKKNQPLVISFPVINQLKESSNSSKETAVVSTLFLKRLRER